jgi:hypothetical protein
MFKSTDMIEHVKEDGTLMLSRRNLFADETNHVSLKPAKTNNEVDISLLRSSVKAPWAFGRGNLKIGASDPLNITVVYGKYSGMIGDLSEPVTVHLEEVFTKGYWGRAKVAKLETPGISVSFMLYSTSDKSSGNLVVNSGNSTYVIKEGKFVQAGEKVKQELKAHLRR